MLPCSRGTVVAAWVPSPSQSARDGRPGQPAAPPLLPRPVSLQAQVPRVFTSTQPPLSPRSLSPPLNRSRPPLASSMTSSSSSRPTSPASWSTGEEQGWAGMPVAPGTAAGQRAMPGVVASTGGMLCSMSSRTLLGACRRRALGCPETCTFTPLPCFSPSTQFCLARGRVRRKHQQEAHQGNSAGAAEEGLEVNRLLRGCE